MLRFKSLRPLSLLTLFFFIFFIGPAEFSLGQEEDTLVNAQKLYQAGDYESAIKTLSDFITKLRAMVEQKKNVSQAFYMLAKIYFEVGDDVKVDENLRKVFETFPAFNIDESNFSFKERVEKVREEFLQKKEAELDKQEEQISPKPRVIQQSTAKTAKKKFPVVLVVVGIVVVAAVVILLAGGKKTPAETFDIRGPWTIFDTSGAEQLWSHFTFTGPSRGSGTFVDDDSDTGTYTVNDRTVSFRYDDFNIIFNGTFVEQNRMNGAYTSILGSRNWRAVRGRAALQGTASYLKQAKAASIK
ncbi:MAG: hypothetical protein NT166_19115 [Candidatus Aminicenantes bacterium]|nr:hypothetical protein [Candidatus Aminicenantes bacterium]